MQDEEHLQGAHERRLGGIASARAILNIIERKFSAKPRSLSGYTYGRPLLCRNDHAAIVGTLAIRRTTC